MNKRKIGWANDFMGVGQGWKTELVLLGKATGDTTLISNSTPSSNNTISESYR